MFPSTLVKYGSPQKAAHRASKTAIEENLKKSKEMVPDLENLGNENPLDILIPPMVIEEDDQFWYQKVSKAPATSSDLLHLQEKLDAELLKREAREIGLCPIRSELYDQCFEELIRQEFMVCPERGRLLRMVYTEKKLSLSAGIGCYESALAYGINKRLTSTQEVARQKTELTNFQLKIGELDETRQDLEAKVPKVKETCDEQEAALNKKCDDEEAKLMEKNEDLLNRMLECIEVDIHVEPAK
ncbi:hypothetical protein JTE90_005097 [Oedothorax gibbosus]|uniref:Inner dynein arm light chain, axonemal n=1 Tax=Oedothorax gibbosus TaxID=931172 RepID=A0AAV6V9P8_9ARAC|nr:hypothetical protein JTE90_005097 [Oedothorax gibbosus]